MKKIAILGSGLAGLSLANSLRERADVTVFEKARGAGGRMSTRYADPYFFDHGAQYFTARSKAFHAFLAPFIEDGTVAEWAPRVTTLSKDEAPYKRDWFEPHYVASPNMNSLCKALSERVDFQRATEIAQLEKSPEGWVLSDKNGETHGPFEWVISTAPAAQTHTLYSPHGDWGALGDVKMTGCYSLMLGLESAPDLPWDAAKVKNSPLGWIAINSSKPGRNADAFSLMAQSTNEWAEAHIDADIPEMQTLLVQELEALTGIDCSNAAYLTTHRWRYAAVQHAQEAPYMLDAENHLAACGDWFGEEAGRVEAAFSSAHHTAQKLLRLI